MPCPTKRICFGDCIFNLRDEVYEPAEDSFLFSENIEVERGDYVLDLGTGSGILAVLAAKKGGLVVAVDLNPHAIHCAHENARLNHVHSKVSFVQADLFTALVFNFKFDVILFNAPYLPSEEGEDATWIGRSWAGGTSGREVVDRFITEVPRHLKFDGKVLLMQSTLSGVQETIDRFNTINLKAAVKAAQNLPFFETLTLIEAKRNP